MSVQDDLREKELIILFQLERPVKPTRSGIDALLDLNGQKIPFELKSTTKSSVTTVRDFGLEHIRKWKGKHWLFGFYETGGLQLNYCLYGSPEKMEPWIREKEAYIYSDYQLAQHTPKRLDLTVLYQILGQKTIYSLEDAQKLHKRQYTLSEYQRQMDVEQGYSPTRMLAILQDRCKYLLERGSTLNNPHIPGSYFQGWEKITRHHAVRLRQLVAQSL
ncbi:MAG: hypothetical protein WBB29_20760 [Geitlerinemataceae cyanobacterium]